MSESSFSFFFSFAFSLSTMYTRSSPKELLVLARKSGAWRTEKGWWIVHKWKRYNIDVEKERSTGEV